MIQILDIQISLEKYRCGYKNVERTLSDDSINEIICALNDELKLPAEIHEKQESSIVIRENNMVKESSIEIRDEQESLVKEFETPYIDENIHFSGNKCSIIY